MPRVGERMAELLEAPLMLAVIVLASRCVTSRLEVAPIARARLVMGLVGLALVLGLELALVRLVRGVPATEYLAQRDPVAGAVYYSLLAVFALMPLVWLRASSGTRGPRAARPR